MSFVMERLTPAPVIDQVVPDVRDEHWEGSFDGEGGSTNGVDFDVTARLKFWAGCLDGLGRGLDFHEAEDGLILAGTVAGAAIEFRMWFEWEKLSGKPFECAGVLSEDGSRIDGQYTVDCHFPETCGCNGGHGRFTLQRVID